MVPFHLVRNDNVPQPNWEDNALAGLVNLLEWECGWEVQSGPIVLDNHPVLSAYLDITNYQKG